ncbi:MAG: TatD family hydrolase [Prevotella sp.]|nr:TatD family hydrolase [Prevotella sp.]MBQ9186932.1 TatD family hydrolase [Prevotella sp.]
MNYIDTHCHLDGEEFGEDRDAVVQRAREAGCRKVFLPAIDLKSCATVTDTCRRYAGYCYPMLGLHPEEVRADWREQLAQIKAAIALSPVPVLAIGEVGLDYYWSREYEREQLEVFEEQVRWSVDMRLPLMIHCRKAQNELVGILKKYKDELPGGVFHCFTGNETEARQLLDFPRFVLGIGGVLTFKKSHLPETLAGGGTADDGAGRVPNVPLSRIVLETDAPYMAPVPMRGQRNEPAYIRHVISRMAAAYQVSEEEVCRQTTANAARVFPLAFADS